MRPSRTGGGAATQAGTDYQNRVAAWIAVRILAEQDASPPWDLPGHVTLEFLRCETEQPVDDLLVGASSNGHVFIQVKHTLSLETSEGSDLASSLSQFVRQLLAYRGAKTGQRPWERPLDVDRDRLVLVTSPRSSAPIRQAVPAILGRLRTLAPGQAIDDAAANAPERDALRVIKNHITRSWRSAMGADPTDDDLRELFSLIRVQVLDIDAGGNNEREAKDLLRLSVLQDPTQADSTWDVLVQTCAEYASARRGAERAVLQRRLLEAGIPLKAPRSYRDDIDRLQALSRSTVKAVSDLSTIRIGSAELKISRQSTLALRGAAETGSLVVVGEPGAGKSGALHDLVEILHSEKRDVIFFAVDRLEASSLGTLRNEIGLLHNLEQVLKNWPSMDPGFLVIDALDAARSEASARTFRSLISMALKFEGRWRVIASIRKFDLRYSPQLQQFFSGQPPTEFRDREFAKVRHLNIPLLGDEELEQIPSQSRDLAELIKRADPALRDLLRVPFNLRLMADLIGSGIAIESLTPIQTQIELLDRYWQERVIRSDPQSDAREAVLRRASEKMVETRSLRMNRTDVSSDPIASPALTDVLSSHVLTEWQPSPETAPDRYVLTFAHHVLFDYAVARLLLRGVPERIIERLEADPELVLAIRPSLVLHFQYLWSINHTYSLFWDLILQIMGSKSIPEVGKVIGPGVAAEQITQLADCEPLLSTLEDAGPTTREAAEQALRHVVGAVVAAPPNPHRPLVGADAPPWYELLERVSRSMQAPVAYTVRLLLTTLCERPDEFTVSQRDFAGKAARRLLEFAWQQTPRDGWLVIHALKAVCRTFESDMLASASLLRRCLGPTHLANYGYEELWWVAREVKRLIPLDAKLVCDIYRAAFSHDETSEAKTPMGSSRILPMASNRRQDYEGALYDLAETYPSFLQGAPTQATHALIAILNTFVARRHKYSENIVDQVFDFDGREAHIRADNSIVWDDRPPYHDEEPLKMLQAFEEHLQSLSNDPGRIKERRELINIIVAENHLAVVWRRLLACGTAAPYTLGREIRSLAWTPPILTLYDTSTKVGDFLTAVFSILEPSDRERIEHAILAIPDAVDQEHRETGERTRDRLLGCLPAEAIVTEEAKERLRELETRDGPPPNEPPFRFFNWRGTYGEEEYLADEGVPVNAEPNKRIRLLEQPIQEFTKQRANSAPTAEEIEGILSALRALHAALAMAQVDGVHAKQCDYAWDCLAEACGKIVKIDELSCETEAGSFVRRVLLEAANHPDPVHHSEYDAKFDEHPAWGKPAVRITAAMGLTWLSRHPTCTNPAVLEAIERLSGDEVPAVRFQVATYLRALYRTASDLMWRILERLCCDESSRGVLQGLLVDPLWHLAGPYADRIVKLVKTIFDRVTEGPGAKEVRKSCVSIFTRLYLWQSHQICRDMVFTIADHPLEYADEAHRIVAGLRDLLMYGPVEPPNPEQDVVRLRAFALMHRVSQSTIAAFRAIEASNAGMRFESWPQEEQERMRSLAQLAEAIGIEVYFGCRAFQDKERGGDSAATSPGMQERRRFLREAGSIIDDLADLALPGLVHHLVETLKFLAIADPEGVFLRLGRVVRAGKAGGYQYESVAADLIVLLMERYFAEYRSVLRANSECRRVILEILDTFVEAGWPRARRLTYRMEEIFR